MPEGTVNQAGNPTKERGYWIDNPPTPQNGGLIYESFEDSSELACRHKIMSEYLIHRRILLEPHHKPTGRTRHTQGAWTSEGVVPGAELPVPHGLVIAQLPPDDGYYLLYLDENGHEVTDTYHDSLEKALDQAEWEFGVHADEWQEKFVAGAQAAAPRVDVACGCHYHFDADAVARIWRSASAYERTQLRPIIETRIPEGTAQAQAQLQRLLTEAR